MGLGKQRRVDDSCDVGDVDSSFDFLAHVLKVKVIGSQEDDGSLQDLIRVLVETSRGAIIVADRDVPLGNVASLGTTGTGASASCILQGQLEASL